MWPSCAEMHCERKENAFMTFCLFLRDTFPEASSCGDYWMYLVLCHLVPALNTSWQPRHEQRCQLIMEKRSAVTCSWSLWAAGHSRCHQRWCIPEALAASAWALCQLYMAKVNSSVLLQGVYRCNELFLERLFIFVVKHPHHEIQYKYILAVSK